MLTFALLQLALALALALNLALPVYTTCVCVCVCSYRQFDALEYSTVVMISAVIALFGFLWGWVGQGRAGQGRAGRAGRGRAGQGRADTQTRNLIEDSFSCLPYHKPTIHTTRLAFGLGAVSFAFIVQISKQQSVLSSLTGR